MGNQYLYYFPQKEIILCSDKLFTDSEKINLIPNELKLKENEFTCMINLNKIYNKQIKINLNIMKPISNNSDKDSLDIFLGDSLIFKNLLFFGNNDTENYYTKNIIVKIKDKEVYFLKNNNCDLVQDINCDYEQAKDSLFKGNHLMLNLKLKLQSQLNESNKDKDVSFIEKKANNNFQVSQDVCDP